MLRRWIALLVPALAVSPARADDAPYVPPDFLSATPELPEGHDSSNTWRLDLAAALQLAVRQNLGVALERSDTRIAALEVDVAGGLFEPSFDASYSHDSSRIPPNTSQEGSAGEILRLRNDRWDVSLSQRLATGMQLSASFASARSSSTAGTAIEPLTYRSALQLSVTQPLLRGFSLDLEIPRLPVLQAQLGSERQRQQLEVVVAE